MASRRRFAVVLLVFFAGLAYDGHGYVSHRRVKNQRPGVRSYPDVNKNNDINICALEQKTTINLFCYCDESARHGATSADCWIFNDGEPADSATWREFRSQPNITKLTFNVRGATTQTLTFVPTEALAQLPELRTLEIVYADIKTVHSYAFANLSRLQDLALGRNNIVRLSQKSIAYMEDLRVVTLGDNFIDGISNDVFAKLPALRKLYMDKNNISYVAEGAFEQLRKLEELDLAENRLSGSLSRYVFLGLVSLKRLDMRANHIDRVGPEAFAELVSLEELVLEDNLIRTIDGRGFSGLINVQRLMLAENRLASLEDNTFARLEKLKFIDIRFNNMHTLTFGTVEPILDRLLNTSFHLLLQGNVFDCHCNLLWMNKLATETNNEQVSTVLSEAQCQMNETTDDGADDGYIVVGQKSYENVVSRGRNGKTDAGADGAGGSVAAVKDVVDGMRGSATAADGGSFDGGADEYVGRSFDESKLVKVGTLDEETCPGKERPAVDGPPDAAQNSDRVLWQSNGSSAAPMTARSSLRLAGVSLLSTVLAVFALFRSRRC